MSGGNVEQIALRQIGIVHSDFNSEQGTPVQPALSQGAPGWIEVFAEYGEGLKDIEGFERLWLLFWCNRARECKLVVVPYLGKSQRGVFATRSPSRPNSIGMSCVRLVGREGLRLDLADVDILDGTPLLDIKPYVPRFDNFEVSKTGWYGDNMPESRQAIKRFTR